MSVALLYIFNLLLLKIQLLTVVFCVCFVAVSQSGSSSDLKVGHTGSV